MIFHVDLDPFAEQVLVCADEIVEAAAMAYLDGFGDALDPSFRDLVREGFAVFEASGGELSTNGLVMTDAGRVGIVMVLRPYEETWSYWETLIHETHHVVYAVAHRRGLVEEREAQAHLQAWLFRTIRHRLQDGATGAMP
jgi:hypothetical protein